MIKIFRIWFFLFLTLVVFHSGAIAAENYDPLENANPDEFNYDDSQDKPWREDPLQDLSPPKDENLVELDIDHPPIGFKVFIDKTSIMVSKSDGVVRYWLVLKAGKSRNAMYEGMKCNTQQYKTFAFENKWKKGKVNIDKSAQWLPTKTGGHNHFRFELQKYFFCSQVLPRPVGDILDIIAGYKSTTSDYDPTFHYAQ